jgi:hypothetical protein
MHPVVEALKDGLQAGLRKLKSLRIEMTFEEDAGKAVVLDWKSDDASDVHATFSINRAVGFEEDKGKLVPGKNTHFTLQATKRDKT